MYKSSAKYGRKKGEKLSSTPYSTFNPHSGEPVIPSTQYFGTSFVNAAFIDPGVRNCAIRFSQYDLSTKQIKTLRQLKIDFVQPDEKVGKETQYYAGSLRQLAVYNEDFRWCHYIIIESQLRTNYDMTRMGQHLITHLLMTVADQGFRPLIIEIDSRVKTQMLGAPPGMDKPQRKKWCLSKAIEIIKSRGESEVLALLTKPGKRDDHGDVICYDEVWWRMCFG